MSKLFASCTARVLLPRGRGDKRLVADGAAVHEVMVASHGPAEYLRRVARPRHVGEPSVAPAAVFLAAASAANPRLLTLSSAVLIGRSSLTFQSSK